MNFAITIQCLLFQSPPTKSNAIMQEVRNRKTATVRRGSAAETAAAEEEVNGRGRVDEKVHRGSELVDGEEVMEPWWQIALQVFFPYIVAGLGMVGAGAVLNVVKVKVITICYLLQTLFLCFMNYTSRIKMIVSYIIFLYNN